MELLRILSDGAFHSGVELAQQLGVSRTTISKRVAEWNAQGIAIHAVNGKGYRLNEPWQLLEASSIQQALTPDVRAMLEQMQLSFQLPSTNDQAMQLLQQGRQRVVCVADMQTQGRGRRGRQWLSPPGGNFYGSFGWQFREGFGALEGLSLATGVAVVQALESVGATGLQLKWPNDILAHGRKLGGVLIEMGGEFAGPCHAVVGIGVNLKLPAHVLESIDQPATDLWSICSTPPQRNQLVAALINQVCQMLVSFTTTGLAPWREKWMQLDVCRDQPVTILGLQQPLQGIARGIDAQGALCIETAAGLQILHGGEVSLRRGEC